MNHSSNLSGTGAPSSPWVSEPYDGSPATIQLFSLYFLLSCAGRRPPHTVVMATEGDHCGRICTTPHRVTMRQFNLPTLYNLPSLPRVVADEARPPQVPPQCIDRDYASAPPNMILMLYQQTGAPEVPSWKNRSRTALRQLFPRYGFVPGLRGEHGCLA